MTNNIAHEDRKFPEVLAFDPTRTHNYHLMVDCAQLGFFDGPGPCVDVTYNSGRFWHDAAAGLAPAPEHRFDIDPQWAVNVADFRNLPLETATIGTVVFDPPYKLSGRTTGKGPSKLDITYDVGQYRSISDVRQLMFDGTLEAARVLAPGGRALVKCQAQQASSRLNDQPGELAQYAIGTKYFKLVGFLHVASGMRNQPSVQRTPRSNYSTLVVLERLRKKFR